MKTNDTYSLTIPSNISSISSAFCGVKQYVNTAFGRVHEDELFDIRVILNELLINAIKHGNMYSAIKTVQIKAGKADKESLYFIIEDEGTGFEYDIPNSTLLDEIGFESEDYLEENGRGMLIVEKLCDRIKYNKKGNKVVVLKKLNVYQ